MAGFFLEHGHGGGSWSIQTERASRDKKLGGINLLTCFLDGPILGWQCIRKTKTKTETWISARFN